MLVPGRRKGYSLSEVERVVGMAVPGALANAQIA
jgi:hypothetical protein